jgi:hypothetical protein
MRLLFIGFSQIMVLMLHFKMSVSISDREVDRPRDFNHYQCSMNLLDFVTSDTLYNVHYKLCFTGLHR